MNNEKKPNSVKLLVSNFSYLSLLEVFGLLFPLLTYPYLIRVLGMNLYGAIVFAQAIFAYVIIITNFGFNVSAVRKISENRADIKTINKIFSSVIYLKIALCIVCLVVYFASLYFFDFQYKIIYILIAGLCLQEIFFPIWFFQGVEDMKYITIVSFVSRITFVILIFITVHSAEDFWIVPLGYSLGGIFASIFSLIVIRRKFKVWFVKVPFNILRHDFKESFPFFGSRFATVVMERSNVLLIGGFFDFGMVSIYDLSVKVISILKIPFSLLAQVLYPHMAKTKNMLLISKLYKYTIFISIIAGITLYFLAPHIVLLLGGENLLSAIPVLRLMAPYLPAAGISSLLGASVLVVMGYSKAYNLSVIYAIALYIILILILLGVNMINVYTMAIAYVLPELFIALYRRYIAKKAKLF